MPLQKIGNGPHGFSTQGFPNLLDIKSSILMAKITSHLPSSTVYQYLRIGNLGDTRKAPAALTCLYGAKVRESFLDGPLRQWCSFSGWAHPRAGQMARGRELGLVLSPRVSPSGGHLGKKRADAPMPRPRGPKGAEGSGRLHHETVFGSQHQRSGASEK